MTPTLSVAFALTVTVPDTVAPLAGAAVYVWHCDRDGRYSLYSPGVTKEMKPRESGLKGARRNPLSTAPTARSASAAGQVRVHDVVERIREGPLAGERRHHGVVDGVLLHPRRDAAEPADPLLRIARQEGWEVLRCDRLSRQLKTAAGLAGAAAIGGAGSAVLAARGRAGRRRRLRLWPPALV